jgi:hypothetical protein
MPLLFVPLQVGHVFEWGRHRAQVAVVLAAVDKRSVRVPVQHARAYPAPEQQLCRVGTFAVDVRSR